MEKDQLEENQNGKIVLHQSSKLDFYLASIGNTVILVTRQVPLINLIRIVSISYTVISFKCMSLPIYFF